MSETFGNFRMRISKTAEGAGVDFDLINGYINGRIETMYRSFPWTRLDSEDTIQTVAAYTDGTVSIDAGGTAVTGVDTVFTAPMTGRRIRFEGTTEYYTFTRLTATTGTIERALEQEDDLEDVGFTIWQAIYDLPDDLSEIFSLTCPALNQPIAQKSQAWLDTYYASRIEYGHPRYFTPYADASDGTKRVELYPGPDVDEGLPLEYKPLQPTYADADTAEIFPDWLHIPCLFSGVLADLGKSGEEKKFQDYLGLNQTDDTRRMSLTKLRSEDRFTRHRGNRMMDQW
jgi:hypothetical protein